VSSESKLAPKTIATARILSSWNIQPAPKHAVLSGEDRKVSQCVELIAVCTCARGKACCNLVSPLLFASSVAGSIGKCFELGGGSAHVGRAAECHAVGGVNCPQRHLVLKPACDNVITGDTAQGYIRNRSRAALQGLRQFRSGSGYESR
jgi:hypothetical protein